MSRFESTRFVRDPKVMNVDVLKSACDALGWTYTIADNDLVVTDVHFPNEKNGQEVADAGFRMINFIQEKRPEQPVIICSSVRYSAQGILGAVLYSDKTDLRFEFKNYN